MQGLPPPERQAQIIRKLGYPLALAGLFALAAVLALHQGLFNRPLRSSAPSPVWHGNGFLRTGNSAGYPLFLKIRFEHKHGGNGFTDGKTNLIGTATICSDSRPLDLEVSGTLDAWFAQNGKNVKLYLRTEKTVNPRLFFLLYGAWRGTDLVLEDRGTIVNLFNSKKSEKELRASTLHGENSEITLHYGEKSEFDAFCPAPAEIPAT